MPGKSLFIFGLGYVGAALARTLLLCGWHVGGTTRSAVKAADLDALGIFVYQDFLPDDRQTSILDAYDAFLFSVPPQEDGDPYFPHVAPYFRHRKHPYWLGYLSSTAVYGDHQGRWVTEASATRAHSLQGKQRLKAENQWQSLPQQPHIFRLGGIYGPGRSAFDVIHEGAAQRIDKPGHVFCRIYIEDILQIIATALSHPTPGIYNLSDDRPSSSADVTEYACQLLGQSPPPLLPYKDAVISPRLQSYYEDCRRVDNHRIKSTFRHRLRFPSYREGLNAIAARP